MNEGYNEPYRLSFKGSWESYAFSLRRLARELVIEKVWDAIINTFTRDLRGGLVGRIMRASRDDIFSRSIEVLVSW